MLEVGQKRPYPHPVIPITSAHPWLQWAYFSSFSFFLFWISWSMTSITELNNTCHDGLKLSFGNLKRIDNCQWIEEEMEKIWKISILNCMLNNCCCFLFCFFRYLLNLVFNNLNCFTIFLPSLHAFW